MDSIERMRRINDLTRELKQHGFAESSFEAIQQANQIYGDEEVQDNVKHGIINNSPNDRMAKDETMGDDSVSYDSRKLAKISEGVDVLTNKMNEIIRAINDLDARITEVKSRQDKLAMQESRVEPRMESRDEPRAESKIETRTEEKPETRAEVKTESHEQHKDDYSMNQRTGNFQSQDVAIDKMFYFGKK